MKKLLFILTVALIAISCTKENKLGSNNSSRRLANINEISGTYTGKSFYTNYYSLDPTIGLGDQSGVDSGYTLISVFRLLFFSGAGGLLLQLF